ncbi:MAG: signal peptidase I [Patescibacteria group bacterium]
MEEEKNNTLKNIAEFIWEMLKTAITVILVVYLIKTFLFQLFIVDGQSMEPTLHDGQMLLVDKLSYYYRQPQRGEIIVFEKPKETQTNFIKRVVGLPGEKITIHNNQIIVYNESNPDGLKLNEDYIPPDSPTNGNQEFTIAANEVFVLGDNRTNSQDSRVIGPINEKLILGRALFTYWPIKDAFWLTTPIYNSSPN